MLHIIEVFISNLLFDTNLLNGVEERLCTTVEDRNLRAVDFDETVVDTAGIESRHCMLDGAYCSLAFADDGATVCGDNIFCNGINYGLTVKVDTLDFVSVIIGSRAESSHQPGSCVKAFALEGKLSLECCLLHYMLFFIFAEEVFR